MSKPPKPGVVKLGRPTLYSDAVRETAAKIAALGATDIEIADILGVGIASIILWKVQHPEFAEALRVAKEPADERVKRSLYQRAVGYTFEATKIFQYEGIPVVVPYREHVPPDVTACAVWLNNRDPKNWKQRRDEPAEPEDAAGRIIEDKTIIAPDEPGPATPVR